MRTNGPDPDIRKALVALSHPTRVRILSLLRTSERASPSDLAERLHIPVGNVSYHVRRLHELGLVTLDRRMQRRGAIKHVYARSPSARADQLIRHVTGKPTEQPDASRASAQALLDASAIGELRADLEQLFARMRELEAQAVARAGVKGHNRAFSVDVCCVMDVTEGAAS